MKSENLYFVWAHPRSDSLTQQVVQQMQNQRVSWNEGIHPRSLSQSFQQC